MLSPPLYYNSSMRRGKRVKPKQECPQCSYPISAIAGSKEAICPNCGFKDPCCE